jgi:hypothetical protein
MTFWRFVVAALAVFVIGVFLLPRPTHYEWEPPIWAKAARVFLMALAITVVWAIVFRRQVEKLQASIYSILVLIGMQAILFWAIQHFDSY